MRSTIHAGRWIALSAIAGLAVGFGAGRLVGSPKDTGRESALAHREIVNSNYLALYSLRTQGAEDTIKGLEGTLDRATVTLAQHIAELNPEERSNVMQLLTDVARYYDQYPRSGDIREDEAEAAQARRRTLDELMMSP